MPVPIAVLQPRPRTAWTPILDGHAAAAARAALSEIVTALADRDPAHTDPSDVCDAALLFAYLSRESDGRWEQRAVNGLNVAVEKIGTGAFPHHALFDGLCELGWTVQHISYVLAGDTASDEADDPLEDVDACLLNVVRHYPEGATYDLISGLVGIGVYFLERLPRASAREGLRLILQLLEDSSESSWGGRTWRTPAEGLPEEQRAVCPNGHYNLGVAHGVPSVVYLLGEMAAGDVERDRALGLLDPVIEWLFARRRPPTAPTRFSSWFVPGAEPTDSRLGWCYGDVGIAAVFGHVGWRLSRADLSQCSHDLLARAIARDVRAGGILDTGLCHGALGLAHIYNRAFQDEGIDAYRTAAIDWYARALAMRRPDVGVAGFFTWRTDCDPPTVADASMLSGAVGAALALLAATSSIDPAWDRRLLVSGRLAQVEAPR